VKVLKLGVLPCLSIGQGIIGWFDGAAQKNGQYSGVGGVVRVSDHQSYKWTFSCGLGTNTREELLGIWAIQQCQQCHIVLIYTLRHFFLILFCPECHVYIIELLPPSVVSLVLT